MEIIRLNDSIPCFQWCANCYLVSCDGHAYIVDPAISYKGIVSALEKDGLTLDGIILTHGHFDHILSADALRRECKCKVYVHEKDAQIMPYPDKNAYSQIFGENTPVHFPCADILIKDGDILPLGDESLTVIHTPGHTAGSVCYLAKEFILTGDTLFCNSYGRYDLYSGSKSDMLDSLRRLRQYDPKLTVYPGHGSTELLGNALDNTIYF